MKGIRAHLLLSVAFLALCLSIAAPVRAYEDTSQMSRAERLLLQDTVAQLWTLHVGIGETLPEDAARRATFGLVKDEQLSPAFVARLVLQLADPDAGTQRLLLEMVATPEDRKSMRVFDKVPQRYTVYLPFSVLEATAREYLGWSFDKTALPKADYILLSEKGLFLDYDAMFQSWPLRHQQQAFALSDNLYQHAGDYWIMEGAVRVPEQAEGDICRISRRERFGILLKRIDAYSWRILFLGFCNSWRPLLLDFDGNLDDRGRLHVLGFDMR